jgi:hypothetical protein
VVPMYEACYEELTHVPPPRPAVTETRS